MEHMKGGSCLTRKHCAILKRLVRDKLSSLLQKFVTYDRKNFYNICPSNVDYSALAYFATSVSYKHKKSITLCPLDVAFNEKTKERGSRKERKKEKSNFYFDLVGLAYKIFSE